MLKNIVVVVIQAEMFEFRSKIEEAEGTVDIQALMQSTSAVVDKCVEDLERYIQGKNIPKMTTSAVRLQYLYKVFHALNITFHIYCTMLVKVIVLYCIVLYCIVLYCMIII